KPLAHHRITMKTGGRAVEAEGCQQPVLLHLREYLVCQAGTGYVHLAGDVIIAYLCWCAIGKESTMFEHSNIRARLFHVGELVRGHHDSEIRITDEVDDDMPQIDRGFRIKSCKWLIEQ